MCVPKIKLKTTGITLTIQDRNEISMVLLSYKPLNLSSVFIKKYRAYTQQWS